MKKILLSGILLLTLVSASLISCSEDSVDTRGTNFTTKDDGPKKPRNPASGIHLGMKLTIGRASRNCDGLGLCSYDATTIAIGDGSNPVEIEATIKKVQAMISASTSKSSNSARSIRVEFWDDAWYEYAKTIFKSDNVILEEDWVVDTAEWNKYGLDLVDTFTFPAGEYVVTQDPETGLYGFNVTSSTK